MEVECMLNTPIHQNQRIWCWNHFPLYYLRKLAINPSKSFIWDSNLVTLPELSNTFLVAACIGLWLHDSNIDVFSSPSFVVLVLSFVLVFAACYDSFFFFFATSKVFSSFLKMKLYAPTFLLLLEAFLFCSLQQAPIHEEYRTLLSYLVVIKRNTIDHENAKNHFVCNGKHFHSRM